jgi:hypothetical protein
MDANLYYWYKRVILYHSTYESEIGDKCELHSPQLPRELLADSKQHGQTLLFVSDNSNRFAKLENFGGVCIPFRRKRKQDDCFFE